MQSATLTPTSFTLPERFDRAFLRHLNDQELKAAHRQTQLDVVLRRVGDAIERLRTVEAELAGRRIPCR